MSVSVREFTIGAFPAVLFGVSLLLGLEAAGSDLTASAFPPGAMGIGFAFGLR